MLLFVFFAMLWSVVLTFDIKDKRYGSTPPFASAGLFLQEVMLRVEYAIEGAALKSSQFASAAFSVFQGDEQMRSSARAIPILTYHRIVWNSDEKNVSVRNFRDQMYALKHAGWETITLEEYKDFMAGKLTLPERSLLITFDDGAKESFYPVDPLFRALHFEGVIFIIASAMYTPESVYYLAPEEIQRLLKSNRWEIGSHSFDGHRPYVADSEGREAIFFADKLWLPEEQRLESEKEFEARVRSDLRKARETLEREFGVEVDAFAFPLGNETGIEGAANFPEGASITERAASELYDLGFLQTSNRDYSFNYPEESKFLAWRVHVHHDWDGARLVQELEGGLPKQLPFSDNFAEDHGWIPAWGTLDRGRNNLSLKAFPDASSASAFLDGSNLWDDYSFDVSMDWQSSHVFLLADVANSKTYDACVYSPGVVRLQSVHNGKVTTLAEMEDERIAYGSDARAGVRVRGAVIECLWNYESIVEAYSRERKGGVGVQVWDSELGKASLRVSEALVRPFMNN
ncbi:polysaccharide deacetylase family protein [Candidatus Kaiserbacteria bacterium]|nr:polysaccharide deacetylase family protein [Candidatus Kaiserbacteria bacterium]